jgi:hypothetical protein
LVEEWASRYSVFGRTALGRQVKQALRGRLFPAEAAGGAAGTHLPFSSAAASRAAAVVWPAVHQSSAAPPAADAAASPATARVSEAQATARELVTAVLNVTVQHMEAAAAARPHMAPAGAPPLQLSGDAAEPASTAEGAPAAGFRASGKGAALRDAEAEREEGEWLSAAQEILLLAVREWPVWPSQQQRPSSLLPAAAGAGEGASLEAQHPSPSIREVAEATRERHAAFLRGSLPAHMLLRPGAAGAPPQPFAPYGELVEACRGLSLSHLLHAVRAPREAASPAAIAAAARHWAGRLQCLPPQPYGPFKMYAGLAVDEDGSGLLGAWPVFGAPHTGQRLRRDGRAAAATRPSPPVGADGQRIDGLRPRRVHPKRRVGLGAPVMTPLQQDLLVAAAGPSGGGQLHLQSMAAAFSALTSSAPQREAAVAGVTEAGSSSSPPTATERRPKPLWGSRTAAQQADFAHLVGSLRAALGEGADVTPASEQASQPPSTAAAPASTPAAPQWGTVSQLLSEAAKAGGSFAGAGFARSPSSDLR